METYKLLLISANRGGGGWQFNRLLCCMEDIYWYDHPSNGKHPWQYVSENNQETKWSPHHFDRLLPDGSVIPLVGERIACYWQDDAWLENWHTIMAQLKLPQGWISIMCHDCPRELRRWFPKACIINLIDDDPVNSGQRHYSTSANYRVNFKHRGQKPDYKTKFAELNEYIQTHSSTPKAKDRWLYQTHGHLSWNNDLEKQYLQHCIDQNIQQNKQKHQQKNYADINTTWNTLDLDKLQNKFGIINEKYHTILEY